MIWIEKNNEITSQVDGFYDLEADKEALRLYLKHVYKNLKYFDSVEERFRFLIDNDYYYDVFQQYTLEEVQELYKYTYNIPFHFQSFMAASKFFEEYAMKDNDGDEFLEDYQDRVLIVSLYLGGGDFDRAKVYVREIMLQHYQPATPTFLNAGKARRGELVSCFLLELDDSLNSIGFNINTAMQLSKIGGGVALNLSKLRARGEAIKEVENAASGVVPVAKLLEDAFSYANQLGQRKGAGAVYLNIFHWDLWELLSSKKINSDEKTRLASLSLGLIVPQKFYDLAAEDKPLYLFAPHTVFKAYGEHLDDMDMDSMYEELLSNPKVKKKECEFTARQMLVRISMIQLESGYPYIVNITNANEQNPLAGIGRIKMSNLCTEIFQIQETSTINDYGVGDIIRRDINCNLGSLNIVNVMEDKRIAEAVRAGMRALTAVSDMSNVQNAPTVKKANEELHSVGLGAMNLHGFLAKNKIPYESEEAKDFARTFFMMMNYYSIEESMEIAKEKGETFAGFEKSSYADGSYFERYLTTDYSPKTEKVKALFDGMYIPNKLDWNMLAAHVQTYGMYNGYRLAIAPTQSISYVQNSTSSVMPVVDTIETRTYQKSTTYYPMPYLNKETFWYYKSAYNINQYKLLDLIAEIQPHVDQGISTILYVNDTTSTRELAKLYLHANKRGLKSLYYTRTRNTNTELCSACVV